VTEVPLAALPAVVTPEVSTAVAASGTHTEEVMEVVVATGKLKEQDREKDLCGPFFLSNSCRNPKSHTIVIHVKVGLPAKTYPSMRRGYRLLWNKATYLPS
jgi:hypothetical protein